MAAVGQIVILNGVSRAGKSSLATAVQDGGSRHLDAHRHGRSQRLHASGTAAGRRPAGGRHSDQAVVRRAPAGREPRPTRTGRRTGSERTPRSPTAACRWTARHRVHDPRRSLGAGLHDQTVKSPATPDSVVSGVGPRCPCPDSAVSEGRGPGARRPPARRRTPFRKAGVSSWWVRLAFRKTAFQGSGLRLRINPRWLVHLRG